MLSFGETWNTYANNSYEPFQPGWEKFYILKTTKLQRKEGITILFKLNQTKSITHKKSKFTYEAKNI